MKIENFKQIGYLMSRKDILEKKLQTKGTIPHFVQIYGGYGIGPHTFLLDNLDSNNNPLHETQSLLEDLHNVIINEAEKELKMVIKEIKSS